MCYLFTAFFRSLSHLMGGKRMPAEENRAGANHDGQQQDCPEQGIFCSGDGETACF